MVSLLDIMVAINTVISKGLKTDVDSRNLEEKFNRPSVRTSLDDLKTSAFMQFGKQREFTIRIYYFPKEIVYSKQELLEVQEKLEEIFFDHLLIKEDFFIYIDEIDFTVTDGVLVATMDFITIEEIERIDLDSDYYMEELEVRYGYINEENIEKIEFKGGK